MNKDDQKDSFQEGDEKHVPEYMQYNPKFYARERARAYDASIKSDILLCGREGSMNITYDPYYHGPYHPYQYGYYPGAEGYLTEELGKEDRSRSPKNQKESFVTPARSPRKSLTNKK